MTAVTDLHAGSRLSDLVRGVTGEARLPALTEQDIGRMRASTEILAKALAGEQPVYGVTRGFGPLVAYAAADDGEDQGAGLIAHLGTAQGEPLPPEVCRLVVRLRLNSMRQGYSAVSPEFLNRLIDIYNRGFVPAIPRHGTVSASGDLQPLAHAALAHTGHGEAWTAGPDGAWTLRPAALALAAAGAESVSWPAREALSFVNGTSVSLAMTITNHVSLRRLVRVGALLSARMAGLLGANPEAYQEGVGRVRGQLGQLTVARWIREDLPSDLRRDVSRPLQEPYSLRCVPQVLGAVLDQLDGLEEILLREATGCTDNPICYEGEVLHGGNFHAMPVGLSSDQLGLCLQQVAYLADRQLALLCDPAGNGGLPPMLTPRPGAGSGLAGVQLSATSFVSRIRQLVYPASLTALPTNGGNQDHVPMALNGANAVAEAAELAWLVAGSLAVGLTQYAHLTDRPADLTGLWGELAVISPPLDRDRPLAGEVRAARDLLLAHAGSRD
ncbi:aromatic amino acid ammonia-lyase [Nonomuraea sp. MCN248]|uniref:Aromatic amino acid ammonia-lyase n=1 Tax=Nonomuraea corallina TaxID=2989783 RepID=A0ABT4SM97_9ACTN|nr:aromatic amino acid ammonia-lyase [Nonomuraea corallina]MDA0638133.1 aromatic amino acid ammonia-lyase [Nonomuraea corallina]